MTVNNAEWAPFHVGMIVHDLEQVTAAYGRVLGVPAWTHFDVAFPAMPWDAGTTDSRLRAAIGKGGGMTFEVIQVVEGVCVQGRWLAQHGEGMHHLGFWVPDLRTAVEQAVADGAGIEWASLRADGAGVAQLRPGSGTGDILPALGDRMAYMGMATGGVTFELCAQPHWDLMQQRTGGDPHRTITPPPWLQELGWGSTPS